MFPRREDGSTRYSRLFMRLSFLFCSSFKASLDTPPAKLRLDTHGSDRNGTTTEIRIFWLIVNYWSCSYGTPQRRCRTRVIDPLFRIIRIVGCSGICHGEDKRNPRMQSEEMWFLSTLAILSGEVFTVDSMNGDCESQRYTNGQSR